MKFTDGNWLLQPGVTAVHPAEVYEAAVDKNSFTIHAPCKKIVYRGDTLGGQMLTIQASSPAPDVIRVLITDVIGGTEGKLTFPITDDEVVDPCVLAGDQQLSIRSGSLTLRVQREGSWRLDFLAGDRPLTSSDSKGIGLIVMENGQRFLHEQLSLSVGENVYGLGERFTSFVKNGQVVDSWNQDGGTGSDQAYKSVPFYLTNKGYGVFVNDPGRVSFEAATEKVSRVQFSVPGSSLEYFVIHGPTPAEILTKYTALTGRPALPPAWSFGLWLTTSFTTNYDEATATSFIDGMQERDLPVRVFHFDCFWMKDFHWCNFLWDERVFPDPAGMLQRFHDRGLKTCVWINPYIARLSELFPEGEQGGYFIKKADGRVWQTDQWQPGMAIVDFTNPNAARWYAEKLRALLRMGVDCFKTDFGERIPTDVVFHDRSDPERMHNYYSYLYNKTVFDLLVEEKGSDEAVVFARSGTAGCQQYPVHWGGDCYSNFESMAESLRGGLSLCLSGFGFWSHDIGGFEGTPPAAVYKRWVAFGLMSSHSRLHGSTSYRVPWIYDDEAVDVLRHFTRLKYTLMPYLFGEACVAHNQGIPMMRAMVLEFPDDPACAHLDRQYMFGHSLLVAPVFSEDGDVDYYLPAGEWADYHTGNAVQGGGWRHETHGFLSLPLLVRPNSVIATGSVEYRPDYDYADGVTYRIYSLSEGYNEKTDVPAIDGQIAQTVVVTYAEAKITVSHADVAKDWSVILMGRARIQSSEGGTWSEQINGIRIVPNNANSVLIITL